MIGHRLLAAVLVVSGCSTGNGSAGIYSLAIDGAPGGALLSVWVEPGTGHRAWLVGGLLGVDPRTVRDGKVGRVVRYDNGTFETVCTTDRVLWWVHGVRDATTTTVYAAGEDGRVLRVREGRCETIPMDVTWSEGTPTFWGLWVRSVDDVTLVGGSAGPGPRGVHVHYDGAHFTRRDETLPASARDRNLYKLAEGPLGTFLVGERGTLLQQRENGAWTAIALPPRVQDTRLVTVACDRLAPVCFAVGGTQDGVVLRGDANGWQPMENLGALPGLSGVAVQDATSVFVVGGSGFTLHTNVISYLAPSIPLTPAGLHGVGANAALVMAVGGELDNATADQRAVVLVRGETVRTFRFDGRDYAASGSERPTLGSGVAGRQ